MARKNATVYTVARLAGVSIATVSRTLAGSSKVAPETRQRVLQAIETLGFVPDPSARRLASQRTDTIALVFPDISGPYYSSVIRGVEHAAGCYDHNVLIYGTHGKESSGRFLRDLTSKVDGLVILARSMEDSFLAWLATQGIPFILLSRAYSQSPSDTISVDNEGGAYQAARHLIGHGHQRLAILSGPPNSPDNRERLSGYERALAKAGLSIPPEWVIDGHFQYEGGRAALEQLLAQPSPPTAVLAANDEMAMGAISAAQRYGRRVPEDLAVVGFDDIQIAEMVCPALTTVHQPMEQLGEQAVELLFERLKTPDAPWRQEILSTHLLVRRSCGCGGDGLLTG
jgi:LacI family transcriptional regulator